jgi:hypothetical protein
LTRSDPTPHGSLQDVIARQLSGSTVFAGATMPQRGSRRGGRAVECAGLENQRIRVSSAAAKNIGVQTESAPCCHRIGLRPICRDFRVPGGSTATGIRTRVSAVRGRRPSPLDDSGGALWSALFREAWLAPPALHQAVARPSLTADKRSGRPPNVPIRYASGGASP